MVSLPDGHSHPVCGDCGEEFATAEQLGEHVDHAHRADDLKQEEENPTNIGPGVTEEYKDP